MQVAYGADSMRLVLIRHAEAAPGSPDELRALTPGGHEQARRLGKRLRAEGIEPDAVLSSPLLRARETAGDLGFGPPEASDALAPGATGEDVRAAIAGRGNTVLVVGHQPDCSEIAAALSGGPEPEFPPAGFHVIEL
jgi:phosphohistidine phosphatase